MVSGTDRRDRLFPPGKVAGVPKDAGDFSIKRVVGEISYLVIKERNFQVGAMNEKFLLFRPVCGEK